MANTKTNAANIANAPYTQIAGLDIGNGCVKGLISSNYVEGDTVVDILSIAARNYGASDTDKIKPAESEVPDIVANIFNRLDATFDTPCVPDQGRYFMGQHSLEARNVRVSLFETGDDNAKSEQPLAFILTLGSIAGKALQDAYAVNNALPGSIAVRVEVATLALPIEEFRFYKDVYAGKYRDRVHKVIIHNFEQDIPVEITIGTIQVFAEGAAAQVAIHAGGTDMAKALLDSARRDSTQEMPQITPELLVSLKGTMGVDIGDGTTNFPIYDGSGNFNPDASMSISDGYGVVLDRARTALKQHDRIAFDNRQALQDFLNEPSNAVVRPAQYGLIKNAVDRAIDEFADKIIDAYNDAIRKFNMKIMAIYVYGGGAYAMKPVLFPRLVEKTRAINGGSEAQPILYFGMPEARVLNRDGLFLAAKRIADILAQRKK